MALRGEWLLGTPVLVLQLSRQLHDDFSTALTAMPGGIGIGGGAGLGFDRWPMERWQRGLLVREVLVLQYHYWLRRVWRAHQCVGRSGGPASPPMTSIPSDASATACSMADLAWNMADAASGTAGSLFSKCNVSWLELTGSWDAEYRPVRGWRGSKLTNGADYAWMA